MWTDELDVNRLLAPHAVLSMFERGRSDSLGVRTCSPSSLPPSLPPSLPGREGPGRTVEREGEMTGRRVTCRYLIHTYLTDTHTHRARTEERGRDRRRGTCLSLYSYTHTHTQLPHRIPTAWKGRTRREKQDEENEREMTGRRVTSHVVILYIYTHTRIPKRNFIGSQSSGRADG